MNEAQPRRRQPRELQLLLIPEVDRACNMGWTTAADRPTQDTRVLKLYCCCWSHMDSCNLPFA